MRQKQSIGKLTYCVNKNERHRSFPTKKVRQFIETYKMPWICKRCGSTLKPDLVIHHKDGDRANNKKDNLQILCFNCHRIIHGKKIRIREKKVAINITIPRRLLNDVEQNVSGQSRSEKLIKCAKLGLQLVVNTQ